VAGNDYFKLEQRLVLAGWACQQLGYASNKAMLEGLRDVEEGYAGDGRSHLVSTILARGSKCLVPAEDLLRYDANIRGHLAYFNKRRKEPLALRYFQHLALIVTELFLDRLFNHEKALRAALNKYVRERNSRRGPVDVQDPEFAAEDLTKLAFWMATGSGKTILMHFHYRQFLHYNNKPLDNILLVTPDEGLSQQHLENMEAAGIPCARFSLEDSGFEAVAKNTVRVIEITKLVEEKKGSGVSVPVEAFEGRNLIFVDEGHRGASSEANRWLGYRAKLAQTGYTFEYSATFGQAIFAAKDEALTQEYGKAILFDYSYKYFYGDGFGKEFEVLNLARETDDAQTKTLLLGNLLAFYEQKHAFRAKSAALLRYHIADPLWIFVGSTVNTNKQAAGSDVLTVVQFFDALLRNDRSWVQKRLKQILDGASGIEDEGGHDVFSGRFKQLKAKGKDADALYRDILKRVFHSSAGGRLHVGDIKGKAGELGLKVSGAEHYFGLVYIGDTASFKDLIEQNCPEVEVEEDQIAEGLFENIKRHDSRINVLIGAKKFIQGWDSWRVTNMGLLNIGRSEGSEIIQLFGRGVRLQGLNHSLKRSAALADVEHPVGLDLLERLNIFAIRANYMAQFRDYLEREGVEPSGEMELRLPIKTNTVFLKKKLIVPRLPLESRFAVSERIVLEAESATEYKVVLDRSTKVDRIGSAGGAFQDTTFAAGTEHWANPQDMFWLDWEAIYLELLQFKEERGFHNLVIKPETVRAILGAGDPTLWSLVCEAAFLKPRDSSQAARLQGAIASVLKKYVENFYRKRQMRWDSARMDYKPIAKSNDNFAEYVVKVPRSDKDLLQSIHDAVKEWTKHYKQLSQDLPNIHFDRHLFQPLLIAKGSKVRSSPPQLNDGERKFVEDLMAFCKSRSSVLKGKELYLLRNLSRGKGIGFFEDSGFYPDFILWVTEGDKQRLVFVEPHGMLNEDHPDNNAKIALHKKLQLQVADARKKSRNKNLALDSFIISQTPYDELQRRHGAGWERGRYAKAHVLFGDEPNHSHIEAILAGTE